MTRRQMAIQFETEDDTDLVALTDRIRQRIASGICTGPEVWMRVCGVNEDDKLIFDDSTPWMIDNAFLSAR